MSSVSSEGNLATSSLPAGVPDRKDAERAAYEEAYSQSREFSSSVLREGLLSSSEAYFQSRIGALAPGKCILEIGCGIGEHSLLAARSGANTVVGIDVAQAAIDTARRHAQEAGLGDRVSFHCMDVESLSFPNRSFDMIVNHEVFSSIDLSAALPELARVLAPQGVVLSLECLGHNPLFNLNRRLNAWRGRRTAWAVTHIVRREHFELMRRSFGAIEVRYFHLVAPYLAPLFLLPLAGLRSKLVRIAERADQTALNRAPEWLRRYCFKAVFELARPVAAPEGAVHV